MAALTITLSGLAQLVDGDIVRGEPDSLYDGISALNEAGPSEISFLGNASYREMFEKTSAGVVLIARGETGGPAGCALVAVDSPSLGFERAVRHFMHAFQRAFSPGIHPRAVIDESATVGEARIHAGAVIMAGAVVGDGTEIGPNAVIGENVHIGRDCHIHSCVSIRERCLVGDRVIIHAGAVIGADGYGFQLAGDRYAKIEQLGIVEIQDDVEIGANTAIDRARFGRTVIGEGTKIDNLVQIGHNVRIGKHSLIVAQSGLAGSSSVGNYVVIAAQAGIAGHVHIDDRAILSARTGVTVSLKGGTTYGGSPAQTMVVHQRERALTRRLPEILKRVKTLEKAAGMAPEKRGQSSGPSED